MRPMKKILCIEDDSFFLNLLSGLLQATPGLTAMGAHNGTDGIALAKSERPDLILLDLMLPDRSGREVLEALRGEHGALVAPVLIFSNLGDKDEIERCLALGARAYYVKSNTLPSEMVEIVTKELGMSVPNPLAF